MTFLPRNGDLLLLCRNCCSGNVCDARTVAPASPFSFVAVTPEEVVDHGAAVPARSRGGAPASAARSGPNRPNRDGEDDRQRWRAQASPVAPATLVPPLVLGTAACRLYSRGWAVRAPDRDDRPPGHDAAADRRAPYGRRADGDPRVLRGRAQSGHDGHERMGRSRARLVAEPSANPDTSVDLPDGSRAVHGRAADDDERPRLWARWALYDKDLDASAARRSRETQVVILEPLTAPQSGRSRSSFAEVRVSRDPQKQSHSRQAIRIDSKRRRT